MAVDFQELPVRDAQQADRGAGLDYIGDSSSVRPAVVRSGAIADVHSTLDSAESLLFKCDHEPIHVLAPTFAVPWKIKNRYDPHDTLG